MNGSTVFVTAITLRVATKAGVGHLDSAGRPLRHQILAITAAAMVILPAASQAGLIPLRAISIPTKVPPLITEIKKRSTQGTTRWWFSCITFAKVVGQSLSEISIRIRTAKFPTANTSVCRKMRLRMSHVNRYNKCTIFRCGSHLMEVQDWPD